MRLITKHFVSLITKGLLLLVLIFPGLALGVNSAAMASSQSPTLMIPVQSTLFATSASSLSKQAAGKAEQGLGSVQKNVGKVSGQAEGIAKKVSGRAKQDLGKTQSALENSGRSVKNSTKNNANEAGIAIDNAGKRIGNAAENAVDDVKGFFGK
jgi:uncharacterized protein YjbJ (UPF0337 family)